MDTFFPTFPNFRIFSIFDDMFLIVFLYNDFQQIDEKFIQYLGDPL